MRKTLLAVFSTVIFIHTNLYANYRYKRTIHIRLPISMISSILRIDSFIPFLFFFVFQPTPVAISKRIHLELKHSNIFLGNSLVFQKTQRQLDSNSGTLEYKAVTLAITPQRICMAATSFDYRFIDIIQWRKKELLTAVSG